MARVVQTVLGPISPENLGRTLTHEHLRLNYEKFFVSPPNRMKDYLKEGLNLRNIGIVQRYPYSHPGNLSITADSKKAVIRDVGEFKEAGGKAIVENTTHGLERDAAFVREISQQTGVHAIVGTGFYLASVQPQDILAKSVEQLCDIMIRDLSEGCSECPQVKCGFIGEVASDYPIDPFEAKAIEATGALQKELGCPVSFHPGRNSEAPAEILRTYAEVGGNPKKAVMSHLDRTFKTKEELLQFADEFDCYLQFDLFGTEVLTYQFDPDTQMPSDFLRIKRIKKLIQEGFSHRILMSHDIHTKHRLMDYGGHGFLHIFDNILPKMLECGISQESIDEITIQNPKNWLSWVP